MPFLGNFKNNIRKKSTFLQKRTTNFPQNGKSDWIIKLYLNKVKRSLIQRQSEHFLGWLYMLPHKLAVFAFSYFLDQNPSHLGSWLHAPTLPDSTERLEKEVILNLSDLYNVDPKNIEGYVTSGGTEANLFSMWLGRTYMERTYTRDNICLLRTELTHYSINKAGRIVGIPDFVVPLDSKSWGVSTNGLQRKVKSLYKRKYKAFILPITLGYTMTGTSDNLSDVLQTVSELKKRYKNIDFFIWIDAALNGLTIPFIETDFSPFSNPEIQSINVDFHKIGLVPYPAGVILYRKKLRKLIDRPISYLPKTDSTISGSRQGSVAAAIWAMIHHLGISGYSEKVNKCLERKKYFVKLLKEEFPSSTILTDPSSISCGVIFKFNITDPKIKERFGLFTKETELTFFPEVRKKYTIYKFYFLPSITNNIIEQFIEELKRTSRFHKVIL